MFKQMNLFVLFFIFSSYSFGTVEGSAFTDFFTDLGNKAWEGLKEAGEAILDGINEATKALVIPGWECGPNDPKYLDGPSHLATQTMVMFTTCVFKMTEINQCCKDHDKCCNEDFVEGVPAAEKERKKPCDPPFCGCLTSAAGWDLLCWNVGNTMCTVMLLAGDKPYKNYLGHIARCKGVDNLLEGWTNVCNGTKASKFYDEYRSFQGCEKIKDVAPELTNEKYEADKKQGKKCTKLCDQKSGQCVDQLKACYKSCDRKPQDCDDEYCNCKKNHPECLLNMMCTPSGDVVQLRKCNQQGPVNKKVCPENEELGGPDCRWCDEQNCGFQMVCYLGCENECRCVAGLLRDDKTGKCVEKGKCSVPKY